MPTLAPGILELDFQGVAVGTPRKVPRDHRPSCQALSLPTGVSLVDMRVATDQASLGQMALSLGIATGAGPRWAESICSDELPLPWLGPVSFHAPFLPASRLGQSPGLAASAVRAMGMVILDGGSPTGRPSSQARLDPVEDSEVSRVVPWEVPTWSSFAAPCLLPPGGFGLEKLPSSHQLSTSNAMGAEEGEGRERVPPL